MKTMSRVVLAIVAVIVAATLVATTANSMKKQEFFSHKLHLESVGLECDACHEGAADATSADVNLLPSPDVCATCHEQSDPFVQEYTAYKPPYRDVIFAHSRHAGTLGIDCMDCHAGIATADHPPSEQGIPDMAMCVNCHSRREINSSCDVCHKRVELMIPDNHTPDFIVDHVELARQNSKSCATCHTQTYCQECHDGAALGVAVREDGKAAADRIGPMASAHDGRDVLVLQRRHDLNYRYTHGADAKTRESDCAICHETSTFCVACHRPETDDARNKPISHEVAGFAAHGHADQARNDIELCAACHDETAAEPTCLRCHKDLVSPHPDGFMEDVHGSWHDDDNAVCFVCHDVRSKITGVGFCTACHEFRRDED